MYFDSVWGSEYSYQVQILYLVKIKSYGQDKYYDQTDDYILKIMPPNQRRTMKK